MRWAAGEVNPGRQTENGMFELCQITAGNYIEQCTGYYGLCSGRSSEGQGLGEEEVVEESFSGNTRRDGRKRA